MTQYQKLMSLTVTAAILGISPGVFADDHKQPAPPAASLGINYLGSSSVWTFDENGDHVSKSYYGLQIQVTEQFKVNTALKLQELYDGVIGDDDFDWEEAVAQIEGVITLNQETGQPIIIVFGKSLETTLKPRLEAVRRSDESRNQPDELEETLGVAMELTPSFLDSLKVSVHETEGGDMKFNSDSIRMTVQAYKALNPKVDAYGSISYETNDLTDDAMAFSAGIVYDMDDILEGLELYGQFTHYQEGFGGLEDNTNVLEVGGNYYLNDKWAFTAGTEISDSDLGREYLNHLGFALKTGPNSNFYGTATFKGDDFNGVEVGWTLKFPKGPKRR